MSVCARLRAGAAALALVLAALLPPPAAATAYAIPGSLPPGCSGSGSSYSCGALSLGWSDTISISGTITLTVGGNFATNNAKINASGSASQLNLVVTGQLQPSYAAVINANVSAGSVSDSSGSVVFGGNLVASGSIALGWASKVSGSIRTSSGDITLAGSHTVGGSVTSGSGAITLGYQTRVGGNVGSAGTVSVGQEARVGGSVTSAGGAVSIGYAAVVGGDVTARSSTLALGGASSVPRCARSVASLTLSLDWAASLGGVCCGSTCSSSCVSNGSGSAMPSTCSKAPFTAGERYSLESRDKSGYYVRHASFVAVLSKVTSGSGSLTHSDATYIARAGRADASCWTFESVNYPGKYLRHQNFVLQLHDSDGSALFDQDSTFCVRTGLASTSAISLESLNYPGYYIRHDSSLALGIDVHDGGSDYAAQATFHVRSPWSSGSSVHHLQIEHVSGSGVTCAPTTFTVRACADSSCSTTVTSGVTGTLTASGSGMTVNWPGGAAFSIASGSSTTTVSMHQTTAGSVVLGTTGVSPSPTSSTSCNFGSPGCTFTAATSALLFTVPDHVAETSQTVSIQAVRQSDSSTQCVAAFANVTKTLAFACSYVNPASGTRPVRVGGKALNAANSTSAACDGSTQGLALAFDATGVAKTSLLYADAGKATLSASYTGSGGDAGLSLAGSASFVSAPASFGFSGVSTGPIPAGAAFAATVTALNGAGAVTPNFGQESTPAGVTLSFTRRQPTGSGADDGSFSGSLGAFSAGAATASHLVWTEVGRGDLSASLSGGSYLGSGLGVNGTTGSSGSGAVGRFVPHHFDVTVTQACSGAFSYAGQPFAVTLRARNAAGAITRNYDGSGVTAPNFAQAVTLADAAAAAGGTLGGGSIAAAAFSAGVASASPSYAFTDKQTAPRTLTLRATDADGVGSAGGSEGSTLVRSGRLRLANAWGSEKSALQLAASTEYWSGSAWVLNAQDSCTSLPAAAVVLSNRLDSRGSATSAWTNSVSAVAFSGGRGTLTLGAPAPGGTGSVDIALNLGSTAADQSCLAAHPASSGAGVGWLRARHGSCAATWDRDPAARANFGIYSAETRKTVHARELF